MDGHIQTQSYREFYSRHLPSLDPAKSEQNVRCIFHDDRMPSLSVNLEKGTWYCHAEGIGGGVKDFKEKLGIPSNAPSAHKAIVAEYDYHDEQGNLLFQTVRYFPKDFKQRQPDGKGGWICNIKGVRRVLYRLPELLRSQGEIVIVEGEKDVDTLYRHGFVATTNPLGAKKWRKEYNQWLCDRDVILIPDNDEAGSKHAAIIVQSLSGIARSIKIVSLPEVSLHGDVSDWFAAGHSADELCAIITKSSVLPNSKIEQAGTERSTALNATKDTCNRSTPDRICDYGLENSSLLFLDQFNQPHVLVEGQPLPLDRRCHRWLRQLMWKHENKSVNGEVLAQAAGTLAALAENGGEKRELHLRSAFHNEALYVMLGSRRIVCIEPGRWFFVEHTPVLFRQIMNLKPLPDPKPGGDTETLIETLHLRKDHDRRLLATYVTLGLLPHIGRPILLATGPQGSAKSTRQRTIKRLLDRTTPESIRLDPRDALQKASHAAVVFIDNATSFPDWAIDMVCRLVTGEGDSKRKLFFDDEDIIYEMSRLVLINGINPPTNRPDFLDRCLCIEFERIRDELRVPEKKYWENFEREHPRWLGAIFNLLAAAMEQFPRIDLPSLPRLADWGVWAAAVYEAKGWGASQFLQDWYGNVTEQNQNVFDASVLLQILLEFMRDRECWQGLPTELLNALTDKAEALKIRIEHDKSFPKTADWLWRRMRELIPILEAQGLRVSRDGRQIVIRCRGIKG